MSDYQQRIADQLLRFKLESIGAVLIEGPKACGKTTTAEQQAGSILYMDDPSEMEQNLQLAQTDIKQLLQGATPRLIDEWQLAPQLWDAIRFEVDHRRNDGQFMLTGSAVPADMSRVKHSGAGRFGWLTMRPMTLWESGESSGEVSLSALLNGAANVEGTSRLSLEQVAFASCRGGWPKAVTKKSEKAALAQIKEYFRAIVQSDVSRVDFVNRDAERAQRLMRSYARHQGAQATIGTIRADMEANEATSMSDNTIESYLGALRKIFIIEDMPAWNPNLRSKTAIRTTDTRYFVDPSVATTALGLAPKDLINDLKTFGLVFETLCVRDLRVYADALGGKVYHYRDANGLECDAVVHLPDGSYGLVEIKLGGEKLIGEGVTNLGKLASKLDTSKMKAPAFSMIITAVGQRAYKRTDGIFIVPVGCLKD
ncbi:MAG: ATP-binding protein [Bacteroidales bacterium]|nr:ATP-binding protein [Bacteroidales bacterium]